MPVANFHVKTTQLKLPNYNPNFTISDFDRVFPNDSEYLFEKEKTMSNVTEINSLRVKHLRSFCKKWQLDERLINPRFSIAVFESDKIYECRVPKTGQSSDTFRHIAGEGGGRNTVVRPANFISLFA